MPRYSILCQEPIGSFVWVVWKKKKRKLINMEATTTKWVECTLYVCSICRCRCRCEICWLTSWRSSTQCANVKSYVRGTDITYFRWRLYAAYSKHIHSLHFSHWHRLHSIKWKWMERATTDHIHSCPFLYLAHTHTHSHTLITSHHVFAWAWTVYFAQ